MTAGKNAIYDSALAWVNGKRAEFREPLLRELPKGLPMVAGACSLARALPGVRAQVQLGEYRVNDGPWRKLPAAVREFYQRFDRGDYPHLIEEEA